MLASILGFAELSMNDSRLAGTDTLEYLRVIKTEGGRAAALTQEVLALSQKQITRPSVTVINDAIRDAEPVLRGALRGRAELVLRLDPAAGRVTVDRTQFEILLEHLATNARDAMPEGGYLTIETSNVDLRGESAEALQVAPGAYVLLSVVDTGLGMDKDTLGHLFEPFFTTKGQGKGIGLGLPVVRGMVRQSRGGISVTSKPGQGTTVRVYLPRVDEAATPAGPGAPVA